LRRIAPSPGMVVALIALFVSLGGVSYGVATGSITGKRIKNNTVGTRDLKNNDIRGGDIRDNSLTGSDVNESRLGKVPSASSADTASSAANASQLGGQAPGAYEERALAGFRDGPVALLADSSTVAKTIATLNLPAGSYAISAKLDVTGTSISAPPVTISCRLLAGTDTDETRTSLVPPASYSSVALQVVHSGTAPFAAVVQCASFTVGGGLAVSAENAKITALPVDSLTNQALGG
jgi:hypothetical protein